MDPKYDKLYDKIDGIILSPRLHLDLTNILLSFIFIDLPCSDKIVRKFLVDDFYKILDKMRNEYLLELGDYSKNADQHYEIQIKNKTIIVLMELTQKQIFHDEIIYFMTFLS